jgi:endogenous inhibitor of DNA gyrase (YacG/DUF329 family)
MTAEQRTCPGCGTAFTWTSAAPRQRFCSPRCKHQWWCHRRRQGTAALSGAAAPAPGDDPRAAPHDPRGDGAPASAGTTAAVPACPHCARPVAIVAWLVPPAAANVTTPPRHAVTIGDNQQRTR